MKKRIYLNMCYLAGLTILLTSLLLLSVFYNELSRQVYSEIEHEAYYMAVSCNQIEDKEGYLDEIAQITSSRISLIDRDGSVLYDNYAEAAALENHGERPEVKSAAERGSGSSTRLSDTLQDQTYYYAILLDNGMVIRLAGTMDSIFRTLFHLIPTMGAVAVIILVLALILANKMTKSIVSPINNVDLRNPQKEIMYDELHPLLDRLLKQNQKIKKQMNEIVEQQQKVVAITENMSEGLILVDRETNIVSLNQSCLSLLMAPDMNYVGKKLILLNRSPQLIEVVEQALDGATHSVILEMNQRYLQVFSNPVFEGEEIQGAVIFILDITERQRSEKMRKEFSANVSHELKTPLTSISGYAELIQHGMVIPDDIPVFAEKIYKEAGRLITLVNDIIKISQLDEKNIGLSKEWINLKTAVEGIVERLREVAAKQGISIELEAQDIGMFAVAQMINELLYNLCENAVKYNKPGGSVRMVVYRADGYVHIRVADTGIGISDNHKERIFERFYRVDKSHSKQTGGTGLGLAIVKHVVEYHDGYIEIGSKIGEGTTITAHLPLTDEENNTLLFTD